MQQELGQESVGRLERLKTRWVTYLKERAGQGMLPGLVLFLVAVLFARTPVVYGAYPLGIALLCGSRKHTLPIFFGLCIGGLTIGVPGLVFGVAYIVALLLRVLISLPQEKSEGKKELFCEGVKARLLTALVMALAISGYEIAISGLLGTTLMFGAATVVGSVTLCFLFSYAFSFGVQVKDILGAPGKTGSHTRVEKLLFEGGVVTILFFVALALREFSIFGLNPALFFAAFATLFLSRRFGALRGCAAGLIISMAASTVYAPAFGLLGLVSGLLWPLGPLYAIGLGATVGVAWCSYVEGLGGFLGVAPEIVVASLLALPLLPKLYSSAIASEVKQERTAAEEMAREVVERDLEGDRGLGRLTAAFDILSRALSERTLAPSREECYSLCDRVCTAYCANCGGRCACWDGEERPGAQALESMANALAEGRGISRGLMPSHLICGCEQLEPLMGEIRREGAKLWQTKRRMVGADNPSQEYAVLADILREYTLSKNREKEVDKGASNAIRRLLSDKNLRTAAVRVMGKRTRKVVMASPSFVGKQRELNALLPAIEDICGCRLAPLRFEVKEGVAVATTMTAPRYALEVAWAGRAAKDGQTSGDRVASFSAKEEGYSYVILSDGMGTGEKAAQTAGLCTLVLEKLLSAGIPQEIGLKMLNRLVARQGEEESATIDLMTFDTYSGHAFFMKSGAAASYVRRENNLFRLRSRTIPIGIVEELDAEKLQFDTQAGDYVIMLSDGVSQTSEDAPWLVELLSKPFGQGLEGVANSILNEAMNHLPRENGVAVRDDATVVVIKINSV